MDKKVYFMWKRRKPIFGNEEKTFSHSLIFLLNSNEKSALLAGILISKIVLQIMSLLDIQCCGKSSSLFLRQKSDKKLARRIFSPIQQTDVEQQDQHEIANHYKDFKRKRVYKEQRRRQSYPAKYLGSRNKRLSLTSTREILQMPCFVFPR